MRLLLLLLSAIGLCLPALGVCAEMLLGDVIYMAAEASAEIEIRLGLGVKMVGEPVVEATSVRVRLHALEPLEHRDWSTTELRFAEADRVLESVALEGSGPRGFELLVAFAEPVSVRMLPQFDDRQVLLVVAPERAYRKLARFGKVRESDPFVINLESRRESVPDVQDIPKHLARTHVVYLVDFENGAETWHRLRIGFFADAVSAQRAVASLKRHFPDAWIERVSAEEVRYAERFRINPETQIARFQDSVEAEAPMAGTAAEVTASIVPITPSTIDDPYESEPVVPRWKERPPAPEPESSALDELLAAARQAFETADYDSAIRLYTKLLGITDGGDRPIVLEMLGVSRESNRQLAHAKALYEAYLAEYPDSDGARRVRQRLAALVALDQPRAPRRAPARSDSGDWRVASYLSQFYRRQSLTVDGRRSVPIDGVFSDFGVSAFRDGADLDQAINVSLSHLLDLTDQDRLDGKEFQVSSAYWEGYSASLRSGIRVGRQSRATAGVLGRFDGAVLTYRATPTLALDLAGGYLVDRSYDAPDDKRPFFGISGEWLSASGAMWVAPFFVQQGADGVLDRQALGLQARLQSERRMLFTLVDYDMHHEALNNVTVMGSLRALNSQLTASYEHRRSPYLTTRNALIGQPVEDLTELEEAVLGLDLDAIARDRTATSDTLRLAVNTRFSDRWAITADVAASDLSSTNASAAVAGLEPRSTLYSSLQIRSMDAFGPASYSALSLRRADSDSGGTTSLFWDNRFSVGGGFRLYPRLRVDHRDFKTSGDTQWTAIPSLRLDYRMSGYLRFEFELGYQWTTREMAARDLDITGIYLQAGYRATF